MDNLDEFFGEDDEAVENTSKRLPVVVCVDTSFSMGRVEGGTPTGETVTKDGKTWNIVTGGDKSMREKLVEALNAFYSEVQKDDVARTSCEIAVVEFGNGARLVDNFATVDKKTAPVITADDDSTDMAQGVELALDTLQKRKQWYKDKGLRYFQPWLLLLTDGEPTEDVSQAQEDTVNLANNNKLTVFPIALNQEASTTKLSGFDPDHKVIEINNIRDFFRWLSQSVSQVSHATPSQKTVSTALPSTAGSIVIKL
jgi:uncharacterized protein YegL